MEMADDGAKSERAEVVTEPPGVVAGKRILVIEDEHIIALDIASGLEDAGAEVLGPASSAAEALKTIGREEIDAAVLDGNLRGNPVDEVAVALRDRSIPFLFVTG